MDADIRDLRAARQIVLRILSDVLRLPTEELLPGRDLAECGWDSTAALETIVALEDTFGVEMNLRALRLGRTADDLTLLVQEALT